MSSEKQRFKWGVLANELAFISSFSIVLGGAIGLLQEFDRWQLALYSLIIGIFIFIWEYPRGQQNGTKVTERRFQRYLTPIISSTKWFSQNYYIRFVVYIWLGTPCCFLLPTLIGGLCVMITSMAYLKAAIGGERWHAPTISSVIDQALLPEKELYNLNLSKVYFEFMKETVC